MSKAKAPMLIYSAPKLIVIYAKMPINSKYSDSQVEQVIQDLLAVLTRHEASVELSLMCLGNATSHIINSSIAKQSQAQVVESFNQALKSSVAS